jgi:oligoendopeptidase F
VSTKPLRAAVAMEETWRLEDLFATPDDWEAELNQIALDYDGLTQYLGRLHEGAGVLLAGLDREEQL